MEVGKGGKGGEGGNMLLIIGKYMCVCDVPRYTVTVEQEPEKC